MFELPDLPFPEHALEPYIDTETMKIHHGKHHRGYVEKLNHALEGHPELQRKTLADLLATLDQLPESIKTAVRNSGGGHANHSLFWKTLSASGGGDPKGKLGESLRSSFGSYESFREKFTEAATGVFGSGWAWLVLDPDDGLEIMGRPNQDSPLMEGLRPLLGLDVWEHAYYLKYQNRRAEYIGAWWNVIDWSAVEERFAKAQQLVLTSA